MFRDLNDRNDPDRVQNMKKVKLTKKQLSAMHLYIFQVLSDIAMDQYRKHTDLQSKDSSIKVDKNGKITIDMRKNGRKKS